MGGGKGDPEWRSWTSAVTDGGQQKYNSCVFLPYERRERQGERHGHYMVVFMYINTRYTGLLGGRGDAGGRGE